MGKFTFPIKTTTYVNICQSNGLIMSKLSTNSLRNIINYKMFIKMRVDNLNLCKKQKQNKNSCAIYPNNSNQLKSHGEIF